MAYVIGEHTKASALASQVLRDATFGGDEVFIAGWSRQDDGNEGMGQE